MSQAIDYIIIIILPIAPTQDPEEQFKGEKLLAKRSW